MSDHLNGADFSALLDDALSPADRGRANAHAASCPSCRKELESLRFLKTRLASSPRKTLPADLALALERRFVQHAPWWDRWLKPAVWIPAGAVAAAAVAVGLWLRQAGAADELPLEPLLAAHSRYSAEALVPEENLVASNYSEQMTSLYANGANSGLQ